MGIEAIGLHKSFGGTPVIRGVSLKVGDGEMVALLGPSGGGKSTVLRILAGLERAEAGEVHLDGQRVDHLDPSARGMGFVFQHYALFRHLRVAENVAFGLRVRGVDAVTARTRVAELLTRAGLAELGQRFPDELSGGQRQRVALARALAPEPKVLLLDEPFGALDARVRSDLREWLRRLHDEVRATTIIVTHDQEEALAIADRVVVVRDGLIEQDGTPLEIVDRPQTEFVARFVGEVNVVDGVIDADGYAANEAVRMRVGGTFPVGCRVRAVVRSHELRVQRAVDGTALVRRIVPVDDRARVELDVGTRRLVARLSRAALHRDELEVGARVALSADDVRAWQVFE